MINITYPAILNLLTQHLGTRRSESAAFLIWYFENFLRMDRLEATDCVCDQSGDRGIDGIYLNTDANLIEVYQAKLFQKAKGTVGDKLLREFQGTLSQFDSEQSLNALVGSAGDADVARLIKRLDLQKHLTEFDVVGCFVCNAELDSNGQAFLRSAPTIRFIGRSELERTHVSAARDTPVTRPITFSVTGYDVAEYIVDSEHRALIAPVKAGELVAMDGIANQAVFAYNVRGPLGGTQVNRDIGKSIGEKSRHKLFPLFHNGMTVVAETVTSDVDKIQVSNYYVVNGCQSLTALFANRRHLTDDLRILTKFIQAPPASPLAEMVTRFSNNQNGVKARDFKSNNPIQIRLQNEFRDKYARDFFFEIKRGEDADNLEVISNEVAGQYLMAFDLKIPWATHRKYQIFEDLHPDIFGRPVVTAHRILLCHVIARRIDAAQASITNQLFARYALTRFFLLYVIRLILDSDQTAAKVLTDPKGFVSDAKRRKRLSATIDNLLSEIVTDLNAEIDQLGEDFDYRGKLRDETWCKELAHEIAATHKKLVDRGRLEAFGQVFKQSAQQRGGHVR
jgi:hypothetical protein